jgi:hypothetical protein
MFKLKRVAANDLIAALNSQVTNVFWQPLPALLSPAGERVQSLEGFDEEFIDIVDYIIRITHRIWEQKNLGFCRDYYADCCPVHTLGGYSDSVEVVIQNTLKTIAAFPDRTLIGENVVWSIDEDEQYYSSHRITSVMTNKADSEFGPATGHTGRVTTIADCVCENNKIVYEWLMRDNGFLIKQLGISIEDAAKYQAQFAVPAAFEDWITSEYNRVIQQQSMLSSTPCRVATPFVEFARSWIETLFNQKNLGELNRFYVLNAAVQWPGGKNTVGLVGIAGIFTQWLCECPDAVAIVDHIAVTYFDENHIDMAIRWSLAGTYNGRTAALRKFNGQPYFILGASHFRIATHEQLVIKEEWTVFDEVAALTNLYRKIPSPTKIRIDVAEIIKTDSGVNDSHV